MRLSLVLLVLSTLAAAGPLPPFSKAALKIRTPPTTPANNTLSPVIVASLTDLKAVYDSLLEPKPNSTLNKHDFWDWLKDTFEAPGLKARSPSSNSTPINSTLGPDLNALGPDLVATLADLKAVYASLNEKRKLSGLKAKRDFWKWLKDTIETTDLKARSADSTSTPANSTLGPDLIATLADLKSVYESINERRMTSGLKVKRDFWSWLKDAFEAPGLKTRSSISSSIPANNTLEPDLISSLTDLKAVYESLNEKRMESGKAKRGFWTWLKDMYGSPPNVNIDSR